MAEEINDPLDPIRAKIETARYIQQTQIVEPANSLIGLAEEARKLHTKISETDFNNLAEVDPNVVYLIYKG